MKGIAQMCSTLELFIFYRTREVGAKRPLGQGPAQEQAQTTNEVAALGEGCPLSLARKRRPDIDPRPQRNRQPPRERRQPLVVDLSHKNPAPPEPTLLSPGPIVCDGSAA